MPLHQSIQRLLLIGAHLESPVAPPVPAPPKRLQPMIDSLARARGEFDQRAIRYGHRYRSGFWAIYLLSAFAVLCAMLPLALGWDSASHALHPFAGFWAVAEVVVIATVSTIFWRGRRSDWQGEWLRARTTAELISYLPLIAPLVDFTKPEAEPNWYLRVLDPGQHLRASDEIARACRINEARTRELLADAWADPDFIASYAQWSMGILQAQKIYHVRTAIRSHALLHRVHRVTSWLFALTALGALGHLLIHSRWLSLVTTFFPALAASLHGALAQSEAYRLHATSESVATKLQTAVDEIGRSGSASPCGPSVTGFKSAVASAVAMILEEHQDWHMLVRPHHLPLA
ncbi:MAG: hypothetical protein JWN85_775 [Gammaproteobacteria bacterium]|nr:hypothetical protein [Gammaproteobacteria bacterium]